MGVSVIVVLFSLHISSMYEGRSPTLVLFLLVYMFGTADPGSSPNGYKLISQASGWVKQGGE